MAHAIMELKQDWDPLIDLDKPMPTPVARGALGNLSNAMEEIWILGQPPLTRYLDFMEDEAVPGVDSNRAKLIDEWRLANDYYQALEKSEAGIANQVECREIDPRTTAMVNTLQGHARYRQTFDSLPTRVGMVELDRLIVFQKHVSRNFVEKLSARLGPSPDPVSLFEFCLPLGKPDTPVNIRQVGSKRYVFSCDSTDFRFHEPTLLTPEQMTGYESFGAIAGIVGLVVGFGSNFLNVINVGKRMLLNNGYHRACALRALGVTHVPCIIQTATRVDELNVVVKSGIADNAEFYFESARPPLLKDYFDAKIRKVVPVRKRVRQIEVNFEVKDYLITQ